MYNFYARRFYVLVLLIISLMIFMSCKDSATDVNTSQNGSVLVKITDAPFPIEFVSEANVTIDRIEVRRSDNNNGNPYIVVSEEVSVLNLVELRNGLTKDLQKVDIPVGSYDLVRLYVSEASILLTNGSQYDLTVPSGAQTGIKVFIKPSLVVEGGLTSELLLDFDISKSFVVLGNPNNLDEINGFHFKPVVRAVNNSMSGRLSGTVKDSSNNIIENAEVRVEQDSVISHTFTNSTGNYAIIGLPSGTYNAFATKAGYDTMRVENVNIVSSNNTEVNFTLISK